MRVLIGTSTFGKHDQKPLKMLEKQRIEHVLNPYGRKLTREEVVKLALHVDGIIAGTEPLDDWVLNQLKKVKVISRCGVGMDNVDVDTAEKLGIKIFNTPDGPTQAVAELTIALVLNLLRKVILMDRSLRKRVWEKHMGTLLKGKKVAIIGFGRIGQKVADLMTPFDVDIAYCDVCSIECSFPEKKKKDLIAWADIITLHCSAIPDKGYVLGKKEIKQMKKGAYLINASRGGLVDEAAAYKSLKKGNLSGAAFDVFQREPYAGPLCEMDNVILTPHIGSYAVESRIEMEIQAVRNLIRGFQLP